MSPVVKFIITQASESVCDYEKVLPGVMFISLVLLWYQLVTRKMYDLFSKVTLNNFLQFSDPKADVEATETLVGCAENLMGAVRQAVKETEAASVKMRSAAISFKKR